MGGDPELMVVNTLKNRIESSLDIFPGNNKHSRLDLGGGFFAYPDNVLMEGTLPPAEVKDQFIHHYRTLFKGMNSLLSKNGSFKVKAQASHVFDDEQLTHKDAIEVGCNPEFCAWQRESYKPVLVGGLRTSGSHIHMGSEALLDPYNQLDAIKLMDIFVGIPVSILDCDPTGQARKQLYGKMGRFRPCPYGVEYRTLSNFWIHCPETTGLVYDLTDHVIKIIENSDQDKYISQTSEDELRTALDDGNKELAVQIMNRIIPSDLINKVMNTPIKFDMSLESNWGI